MSTAVAVFLLFSAVLWGRKEAFSDDAKDCCLSTSGIKVPRHIVESYSLQTIERGCPISATVFVTKKKRKLCSPPAEDKEHLWVAILIKYLDKVTSTNQ